MEHSNFPSYFFPELCEAIRRGYHHSFRLQADGQVECLSNPDKFYHFDEVFQDFIHCPMRKATIYLITTLDGLYKGTLVDYWESHS